MEHIQKDDIIIRKGILHILDSHTGYLGLSSQLLDMGPDLMEFVRGHIFKIMESDDAKRCQFDGSVSPILSLLESMDETDDESFIEATRILGENLFDIMCDSVTIPAGDLLCVTFQVQSVVHLALLKMNYKVTYVHQEEEDVAQKVGIGAIIFNDLYNQRIKDVTFTWEKIHSFDGETGPYVQYTYARAASVLRKTGITEVGDIDASLVTDETSVALLKEIERFPEVIKVAADRLEPSVVSRYVMGVAQSFNRFYHENQCNVEDQKLKEARVKIVILAKQVIKDALELLGIQCPEQM